MKDLTTMQNARLVGQFISLMAYIDAMDDDPAICGGWAGVERSNIPKPDFTSARALRKEILDDCLSD